MAEKVIEDNWKPFQDATSESLDMLRAFVQIHEKLGSQLAMRYGDSRLGLAAFAATCDGPLTEREQALLERIAAVMNAEISGSSTLVESSQAAWASDPYGRYELRYWDGSAWTAQVSSARLTGTDPIQ